MYRRLVKKSYKNIAYQRLDNKIIVTVEMSPFDRFGQPTRLECTKEEILEWLKTNEVLTGDLISGCNLNNVNHKLCSGIFEFDLPKQQKTKKVLDKSPEHVIISNEEIESKSARKTSSRKQTRRKPSKKTHKLFRDEDLG